MKVTDSSLSSLPRGEAGGKTPTGDKSSRLPPCVDGRRMSSRVTSSRVPTSTKPPNCASTPGSVAPLSMRRASSALSSTRSFSFSGCSDSSDQEEALELTEGAGKAPSSAVVSSALAASRAWPCARWLSTESSPPPCAMPKPPGLEARTAGLASMAVKPLGTPSSMARFCPSWIRRLISLKLSRLMLPSSQQVASTRHPCSVWQHSFGPQVCGVQPSPPMACSLLPIATHG
mmetsp:Transcript_31516/g.71604  ORF Transcript_31516/g.71604 Transcript_31516/m.71604 type:complete len:231 (-) Transcript_31516:67-759(-)